MIKLGDKVKDVMSKLDIVGHTENLLTGKVSPITRGQADWEDKKTNEMKEKLGDCDNCCEWTDGWGWVPECGCPVHDPAVLLSIP